VAVAAPDAGGDTGGAGPGGGAPAGAPARVVVVKLGGEVLEGRALPLVGADLARAAAAPGRRLLVVHGGGPQVTELGERLGVPARIVGGRRVTDAATLDLLKMTVAGRLNVDLVAALRAQGVRALGLAGSSGVVRARRRPPRVVSGGGPGPVDFGLVGDVEGFDVALLGQVAAAGLLPVISCLGAGAGDEVLNINADVVASALAAQLGAEALVAVAGVGGVRRDRDDPRTRIPRLTVAEARAAIAAGVVQGGMIPKLEEAFSPLGAGVAAVHVVGPGEVAASLDAPGSVGTLLVPG
jgi:acetylglutamate kinase